MKHQHGEWYVGAGNMICGRGCERKASDIIAELEGTLDQVREIVMVEPLPQAGPWVYQAFAKLREMLK